MEQLISLLRPTPGASEVEYKLIKDPTSYRNVHVYNIFSGTIKPQLQRACMTPSGKAKECVQTYTLREDFSNMLSSPCTPLLRRECDASCTTLLADYKDRREALRVMGKHTLSETMLSSLGPTKNVDPI
ncbi:hypothetical protein SRHO_G00170520 [Serrasalmus rhombeus]